MQDTALILSGLIIGAIIGLTGVGGGSSVAALRCVALLMVGRHDSHSPRCQLAPHFGLAAVVV